MNRRSNDVEGEVYFPINDMENTMEGGMFVKLWVIPPKDHEGVCCGTFVYDVLTEVFVGTDIDSFPEFPEEWPSEPERMTEMIIENEIDRKDYLQKYWSVEEDDFGLTTSIPLLASVMLGSTGWSNGEWRATIKDLSFKAQELMGLFQEMYPTAELRIITFLDT